MAILRFAVTAEFEDSVDAKISCNDVLSMQDVVMRIGNDLSQPTGSNPTGLKMMNIKTSAFIGDFKPGMFVKGILDRFVGKSKGEVMEFTSGGPRSYDPPRHISADQARWKPTRNTDRLFSFLLIAVDKIPQELQQRLTYVFGMQEDSVEVEISDEQVEKYNADSCKVHGAGTSLVQTFHRNGGTTIFYGEDQAYPSVPFNILSRLKPKSEKSKIYGRPLASFSLCELMMFKHTFMRSIEIEIKEVVARTTTYRDTALVGELQEIYASALWYRVHCGTSTQVSTSTAVEAQYVAWAATMALHEKEERVIGLVKDIHELLGDVVAKQSQHRIDSLALVLAIVGLAGISNDMIANFFSTENVQVQAKLLYWPSAVLVVFLGIAMILVSALGLRKGGTKGGTSRI